MHQRIGYGARDVRAAFQTQVLSLILQTIYFDETRRINSFFCELNSQLFYILKFEHAEIQ